MVEQFFPSPQVKLSVIISNKWYIRVAERFKTYEIRKYQETLKYFVNDCGFFALISSKNIVFIGKNI